MNKLLIIFCCAIIAGCVSFPSRYDRIEESKLRVLALEYSPNAEGVPGDTLSARLTFAGDSIVGVDDLQVSYQFISTEFGTNVYGNRMALTLPAPLVLSRDTARFAFVIPADVFAQEIAAAMTLYTLSPADSLLLMQLNNGNRDSIRTIAGMLTPHQDLLMSRFSIAATLFVTAHSKNGSQLKIRSSFTVRYNRLFEGLPQKSIILPVNNNPPVYSIALYAVPRAARSPGFGEAINLDSYAPFYIYNQLHPDSVRDTISIDTGFTYYVAASASVKSIGFATAPKRLATAGKLRLEVPGGQVVAYVNAGDSVGKSYVCPAPRRVVYLVNSHIGDTILAAGTTLYSTTGNLVTVLLDTGGVAFLTTLDTALCKAEFTTRDMGISNFGTIGFEVYSYNWFFQNLDNAAMPPDSLIAISGGGEQAVFLPPVDTTMHRFGFWVAVTDGFWGETNRPVGVTLKGGTGYFRYSAAYARKYSPIGSAFAQSSYGMTGGLD